MFNSGYTNLKNVLLVTTKDSNNQQMAIDFTKIGVYTITFDYIDEAGNKANTASIQFNIIDKTSPKMFNFWWEWSNT